MKKRNLALLACAILCSNLQAFVIIGDALLSKPAQLGQLNIALHNSIFYAKSKTSNWVEIENHTIKGLPKDLTDEQLINFYVKGDGYLKVRVIGNELGLEACSRGRGGGPLLGVAAGWAVRWSMVLGVGTAIISTGGAVAMAALAAAGVGATGVVVATTTGAILVSEALGIFGFIDAAAIAVQQAATALPTP